MTIFLIFIPPNVPNIRDLFHVLCHQNRLTPDCFASPRGTWHWAIERYTSSSTVESLFYAISRLPIQNPPAYLTLTLPDVATQGMLTSLLRPLLCRPDVPNATH